MNRIKQPHHTPSLPDIAGDHAHAQDLLRCLMRAANIQHFKASEFMRVLPYDVGVMMPVIEMADMVRARFGSPVIIISHFRPLSWNQGKGQSPKSQHLWARALDLRPQNGDVEVLHKAALEVARTMPDFTGVGIYDTFIHIDTSTSEMDGGRTRNSRWDERSGNA